MQDPVTMVRVTYAENIALLAETALRFYCFVQLITFSIAKMYNTYSCVRASFCVSLFVFFFENTVVVIVRGCQYQWS